MRSLLVVVAFLAAMLALTAIYAVIGETVVALVIGLVLLVAVPGGAIWSTIHDR